ncbi:MJ0042-type zinc finger domain-containing protein [Maricaulis parjimensis]|uniref:MJ0042-type zinc finger domain-containing protein n=1 Tax=Maricaulis parjimensis TaxID=144023 RepID=UPI001939B28A|nr:MJ0042-type zinc finger domain-containing protein [Maricaulis parjimensis]
MSIVLSCPSCSTRYRANSDAIGATGRRVRCASCGHVWTAEAENPTVQDAPQVEPAAAEPPKTEAESMPHKAFRARQERKRHTLSMAAAGGAWGGLLAACLVLFVSAWIFRVDIVTLWPRASSAYAAVGATVNPYGFSVGELDIRRESAHGVPLLVVEGDIHNFDRRARAVPGLRAVLRDEHGESLLEWQISMPAGDVKAGRRRTFSTVVSDPPPQAVEVEVLLMARAANGNGGHETEAGEHAADPHASDGHAPAEGAHDEAAPAQASHDEPSHEEPGHAEPAPAEAAHSEPAHPAPAHGPANSDHH